MFQTNGSQMRDQPCCALLHILGTPWLRADTGKTNEVF
jgi:hypothetical protein